MLVAAPTFTPSPYTSLQAVTSTPIYTMEVSSSSGIIEKFSRRPGTISLREFKVTFSTVVCELELKYGANYTEAFAFKQLARYVHYEALDVYEQHSARILGVSQAPNPAYAIAIATASQAALQAIIAHHGTVPNNPDPLATFSRQNDETLKMLYRRLLKLKEDTQSIIDLEAAHWYLCSLEGTPTLHAQVLQRVFAEFGDSYTLMDVYNISEKLELVHAHYEATSFVVPQPKAKAPQPSTQALPTKGNSNKNAKKKEQNADKREVFQAHAIQVQTLQNELESLRAQLANLKGKSSQPTNHAQPVQGSGSREGPPRSFYGLPHDAMVGEYVLSTPHNFGLTLEFDTSFYPSYVTAHEASVAPRVSATRQIIQTDGLKSGSSPITRARGARAVMP
ncbi:unnamed protein product [Sphagnum tenellum]